MTWRQAMEDARAFIQEQAPDLDYRTVEYIARTVLRIGERLQSPLHRLRDQWYGRER